MQSRTIVSALTVAAIGFSSLSFAQEYERRGPNQGPPRVVQPQHRQPPAPPRDAHRDDRPDPRGPQGFDNHRDARNDRHLEARGPQFHRGGRIPSEYRRHQYVVSDWRAHRLHAPARGQQWVQVGADYALIAIATGVIAQLVLNSR